MNAVMRWILLLVICVWIACDHPVTDHQQVLTADIPPQPRIDSLSDSIYRCAAFRQQAAPADTPVTAEPPSLVNTGRTTPNELVRFAETLVGTPYAWASTDPKKGFDCSGFITYVFSHFNINVPRSSIDFTRVGKTIPVREAKRGDVILFTGTNPLESTVGHMGLVVSNGDEGLQFIHSSSGKVMGVTITPLNERYQKRFVRVARIF